jgi:2-polyprenyl-3-methyl-5-hydroxy-6-metoxy-1,4-benzoquinol methylase
MKQIIFSIINNPTFARAFLNFFLKLDNLNYKIISLMSIAVEGGIHPKHSILQYEEWFKQQVSPESNILDIGCNTGTLLRHLSDKIKTGVGIEIEDKHIKVARQLTHQENISFYCEDATLFDFNKVSQINYITLSNVLEHIEFRVDFLKKIIKNINNSECLFLIRVPLITRDWVSVYKKQRQVEYRLDKTHYIEYREQEIIQELEESGLSIISQENYFGETYIIAKISPA